MSRSQTDVGLNANTSIREAIQKIALHGLYDKRRGTLYDTQYTPGYVTKIHTDDEWAGTIDVKEYSSSIIGDGDGDAPVHEHVWLSAIQESGKGYVVVPKLNSEVLIHRDPNTNIEFVVMASLIDVLQLQSENEVLVGVKEREAFSPTVDSDADIEDVSFTGKSAVTDYSKDNIKTTVTDGSDTAVEKIEPGKITQTVGDTEVQVENGHVYLGSTSNTSHAVLGEELADILNEILLAIAQITTTTSLGPQPAINMSSFLVLKEKISGFKTALTGFLTQKVLIQK